MHILHTIHIYICIYIYVYIYMYIYIYILCKYTFPSYTSLNTSQVFVSNVPIVAGLSKSQLRVASTGGEPANHRISPRTTYEVVK